MPDISMCSNKTCPLRMTCYRFIAKANPWGQSYGDFKWTEDNEGKVTCDSYSDSAPYKTNYDES